MKKSIVFAIFSVLAFLSGNPKAKANTNENALNPLGNDKGMADGIKVAGCSLDDNLPASVFDNMKNAINQAY